MTADKVLSKTTLVEPTELSPVVVTPSPAQVQALLLRSAYFIVQALSQNVLFRQTGSAITNELGEVMTSLGIHYDACPCGCKGL